MKNYKCYLLLATCYLLLGSCKKNYYCTCTVAAWGKNTTTAPTKYYNTKTQATKECSSLNKTIATETVTCELN
ncbi:MAG TPA: hypothetical protein VF411_00690 [Bacteroidia bacterium]